MNVQDILTSVVAAEREAAALILQAHGILAECKSGRRDVVTEYDRRVQALLVERLSAAVPDARFFCEENDRHDDLHADCVFIIDPIDGTMNFVRGFHHSCISVACMRRGSLVAGAIYNPYVDELFTAVKGEGAFRSKAAAPSSTAGPSTSPARAWASPWSASAPPPTPPRSPIGALP